METGAIKPTPRRTANARITNIYRKFNDIEVKLLKWIFLHVIVRKLYVRPVQHGPGCRVSVDRGKSFVDAPDATDSSGGFPAKGNRG